MSKEIGFFSATAFLATTFFAGAAFLATTFFGLSALATDFLIIFKEKAGFLGAASSSLAAPLANAAKGLAFFAGAAFSSLASVFFANPPVNLANGLFPPTFASVITIVPGVLDLTASSPVLNGALAEGANPWTATAVREMMASENFIFKDVCVGWYLILIDLWDGRSEMGATRKYF